MTIGAMRQTPKAVEGPSPRLSNRASAFARSALADSPFEAVLSSATSKVPAHRTPQTGDDRERPSARIEEPQAQRSDAQRRSASRGRDAHPTATTRNRGAGERPTTLSEREEPHEDEVDEGETSERDPVDETAMDRAAMHAPVTPTHSDTVERAFASLAGAPPERTSAQTLGESLGRAASAGRVASAFDQATPSAHVADTDPQNDGASEGPAEGLDDVEGQAGHGDGSDAEFVASRRLDDLVRSANRRLGTSEESLEEADGEFELRGASAGEDLEGSLDAVAGSGNAAGDDAQEAARPSAGHETTSSLAALQSPPKGGRPSPSTGNVAPGEHLSRELETLARSRRQDAATSAVNHLTLRHGAEGQLDLGELGLVTVTARTVAGEVDVKIRASNEETASILQSTSALLEGELRRESVEIRNLDVEHQQRERRGDGDSSGKERPDERPTREPGEASPPEAEENFEASVRFVLQGTEPLGSN